MYSELLPDEVLVTLLEFELLLRSVVGVRYAGVELRVTDSDVVTLLVPVEELPVLEFIMLLLFSTNTVPVLSFVCVDLLTVVDFSVPLVYSP